MTSPTSDQRRIDYVPLDEITTAIQNPKKHAKDLIESSISRFGFVEPLVLDERTGRLLAGHGRLSDLKRREVAGDDPPNGISVVNGRWAAPVVRGWSSRSDLDADAALVAVNRIGERGGWDESGLADLLAGLAESHTGFEGVGYDQDDLFQLLAELDSGRAVGDLLKIVEANPEKELAMDDEKTMAADHFAKLSFVFTHEDRDYVATKLRWFQRTHKLDSAALALRRVVDLIDTSVEEG